MSVPEFFLSMLGVNIAVGARRGWPGVFPQRLLVIDEFGTFASMVEWMHRRPGGQGSPPALDQRRQIEWQGRQAGHRLVVAVHQPDLRWFGDTDSPGQYGYRLITGAYTSSLWRMTFGYTAPIQWDPDQGPRRGRHRGGRGTDPPRPARLDVRRGTPPLRADRRRGRARP
jgi:hypothetical protein